MNNHIVSKKKKFKSRRPPGVHYFRIFKRNCLEFSIFNSFYISCTFVFVKKNLKKINYIKPNFFIYMLYIIFCNL